MFNPRTSSGASYADHAGVGNSRLYVLLALLTSDLVGTCKHDDYFVLSRNAFDVTTCSPSISSGKERRTASSSTFLLSASVDFQNRVDPPRRDRIPAEATLRLAQSLRARAWFTKEVEERVRQFPLPGMA